MAKERTFYDVKGKTKFKSSDYRIETKVSKKGRTTRFAVAKAPSGIEAWLIIPKE